MVVASQAVGTRTIMLPCGQAVGHKNITCRTRFLTSAAMDAQVIIDGEFLVADHPRVEVGPNDM